MEDPHEPPHNYEAEKALLGAIFADNLAYEKVAGFLRPEYFADPNHGRIFKVCAEMIETGHVADPITLMNFFERDGVLVDVGGSKYLAELAASMVTIINAEDYGRTIHECHLKRQLINIGETLLDKAYGEGEAQSVREEIEERLFSLAGEDVRGPEQIAGITKRVYERAVIARESDGTTGLSTGLDDLDKLLGGLHDTDLIIMAGRPGMGKTALASNIAFYVARSAVPVLFLSLEMSADQLALRELCSRGGFSSHKVRMGMVSLDTLEILETKSQEMAKLPIYIDDQSNLSIRQIRTISRQAKRRWDIGLIVVDYIQLADAEVSKGDGRVQEVSKITRGLKGIAKDLRVPVIALSQLSRAVEQRDDKRPNLSDLRESGSIEQDADVVGFLYREEYYLDRAIPKQKMGEEDEKFFFRTRRWEERKNEARNKADFLVAKQRHGPIGTVSLHFNAETTTFSNLTVVSQFEI